MAVSGRTQQGMWGDHAQEIYTPRSRAEAEALRDEMKATGLYRRVEVRQWNNGSRARPLPAFKVLYWLKK